MRYSRPRTLRSDSAPGSSAKLWLSIILIAIVGAAIATARITPSAESKGLDGSRRASEAQAKRINLGRGARDRNAQKQAENRTTSGFVSPLLATITVDTTADVPVLSACTAAPADCTLRGAVEFANANPGTTISVPAGTYTLVIPGGAVEGFNGDNLIGDLDFKADNTSVIGAGASTTIIQQTGPNDRVIEVNPFLDPDLDFSISGVTISGGNETTGVGGGGIISGSINNTTTVTNCTFSGNSANGIGGGGIGHQGGSLTVTGSTFTGNSTSSSGGAINYSAGDPFGRSPSTGALVISGSTFSNNTANSTAGGGGGLDLYNFNGGIGTYSVSTSSFSGNAATNGSGGAILVESGPLTLTTSSLANNSAGAAGGAIASHGSASVTYSRLVGNTAPTATNGVTLFRGGGTMTAEDNWWGRNAGPAPNDFRASGGISLTPTTWLQLQHSANPNTLCVGDTSTLSADILKRNVGPDLTTELNGLPTFPATFTNTTPARGTVTGATDFVNGQASATFTATSAGTASIDVTADNETVTATVLIDSNSTTDPADQVVCEGANATFTTTASGPGTVTFVWKKGATVLSDGDLGGRVSGATTNSLTISNVQASDADTYTVEATGSCNTASQSATLTVNEATTATDPADATVCEGAVANFSTTATGSNLTYAWTVDGSPAGGNSPNLAVDTAGFTAGAHTIGLTVTGGCNAVVHSATLTVNANTTATDPADATVCEGAMANFSTTASGTNVSYAWTVDGNPAGGNSPNLAIDSTGFSAGAHPVTLTVTGECGTVNHSATLTVNANTTATDPNDATVCEGATASLSTTATGSNLQFAWTVDGSPAGGNSPTLNVDTTGFSAGAHPVTLTVTGECGTVNHSATLTVNANTTATDPADAAVCQGAMANFSTTASGTNISYAWTLDGNSTGSNSPNLAVDTTSLSPGSHEVGLTVSGSCGTVVHTANLTVNAPTATSDPADQSVCQGATATFTTTATGTGPFSFVWKKGVMILTNGDFGGRVSIVNTATTSTLTIINAQPTDAGTYTVDTTGECGTASQSANLAVDSGPPVITTNGQTLTIWPPNHKYSTFAVNQFVTGASDVCDSGVDINDVVITSVTSDELEDNPSGADGNTVDDIVIAADCKTVQLRAERDGNLDGRIYTITFAVTDSQGNVGTATAKVQVPKNNNGTAVDSGVKYTETGVCP